MLVRILGSALVGSLITFAMLWGGVKSHMAYKKYREGRKVHDVEILSTSDRMDMAELLGEEPGPRRPALPQMKDIPRFELPQRKSTGFVQLEVSVAPDGTVSAVEVVGSTVPAAHEERVRQEVMGRQYEPQYYDGRPVPSVRTEIVDVALEEQTP